MEVFGTRLIYRVLIMPFFPSFSLISSPCLTHPLSLNSPIKAIENTLVSLVSTKKNGDIEGEDLRCHDPEPHHMIQI